MKMMKPLDDKLSRFVGENELRCTKGGTRVRDFARELPDGQIKTLVEQNRLRVGAGN
jgi:hypothetical protein